MEALSITEPMGDPAVCAERETPYVELSNYKDLRLVAFTDSPLDLMIIHSLDGIVEGIANRYKLIANAWRSERFEPLMGYIKIKVMNVSPSPNGNLVVSVKGLRRNSMMLASAEPPQFVRKPTEALPIEVEDVKEEVIERSKSPFRKFVAFKKPGGGSKSAPASPKVEERLPPFIPHSALLMGGMKNKVDCIPRGNPGEILAIGADGYPCWVLPERLFSAKSAIPDGWAD